MSLESTLNEITLVDMKSMPNSTDLNILFAHFPGIMTMQTLDDSGLLNSDPILFGPSQFGPRPLVNSHTFSLVISDFNIRHCSKSIYHV